MFGVSVSFKAALRVMAWVAGKVEGWMVLVELGSGVCSPSVRSLHTDTRGSRRAGAICSSCRNGP